MHEELAKNTLVKVRLDGKRPYIGFVMNCEVSDGTLTGVYVGYLCQLNGKLHRDYGKWRCFTPDKVEVLDLASKEGKLASRAMTDLHKGG